MAVDYLDALKQFSAAGGTDINAFLKQHTTPPAAGVAAAAPIQAAAPAPTPATALGAAPIAPAPVASDTVTAAPAAMAAMTPPPAPPAPAPIAPPPEPAPISSPARLDYTTGSNVVRQAQRTPAEGSIDQHDFRLPSEQTSGRPFLQSQTQTGFTPDSNVVRQTTAPIGQAPVENGANAALARNAIRGRTLYPSADAQARMAVQPSTPMNLVEKQRQNAFDKSFNFTPTWDAQGNRLNAPPMSTAPRQPAAKKDPYDIGPYSEDSTGSFGSGWKPPVTSSAGVSSSPSGPRVAQAESDTPPGAAPYAQGPLANPRPSATPARPGLSSAVAALPRQRNQRMASTGTSRIFSGA